MKFKKLFFFIFAIMLFFASCDSYGGSGEYAIPDYSDCEGEIGIMAFHAPGYGPSSNNFYKSQTQWNWVAEAGYNIVLPLTMNFNSPQSMPLEQLNYAHEAGLKMILTDAAMANSRASSGNGLDVASDNKNTHLYKEHPAFYGIYICDEPSPGNWRFVNDRMAECKQEFGNDKILFANHCFWSTSFVSLDYQYEELFDTISNTNVLSYDGYCMMEDGTVKSSFLSDAAITSYCAKRNGALSCNYILVSGGYDRYRYCSEEDIRWQTNVMLAYGYDIIGHFTYGSFSTAERVIDDDTAQRTELYYKIQKVNNEARSIEKIYKSFEWQGTAIAEGEERDVDSLCESVWSDFVEEEIPGVKKIDSTQNVLCGIFKDKNQNMGYMLTNAINPYREVTAETIVEFDKAYKGVLVIDKNYAENGWTIVDLNKGKCTITLAPGEGKFIIPLKYK